MIPLTNAQQMTLRKMYSFRVVAQFVSGAVVAVYDQLYQTANVIDTDGCVYSFSRFLTSMDRQGSVRYAFAQVTEDQHSYPS
jgi:hypothetical protein